MKPIILAAVCATLAGQVQALSCLRPDPIRTFQEVAAAQEPYYLLYGTLTFDESALPPTMRQDTGGAVDPIPATFNGHALTSNGFTTDFDALAQVQVGCVANWCGTAQSGGDALYFVRADQDPLTIEARPCGGMIFDAPSQAVLDRLTACMQGGDCSAQPFE